MSSSARPLLLARRSRGRRARVPEKRPGEHPQQRRDDEIARPVGEQVRQRPVLDAAVDARRPRRRRRGREEEEEERGERPRLLFLPLRFVEEVGDDAGDPLRGVARLFVFLGGVGG